ncbi:hypothetical protein MRX96_007516 [Rhipicephalus microplus]
MMSIATRMHPCGALVLCRRCCTGEGAFQFRTHRGQEVIRELKRAVSLWAARKAALASWCQSRAVAQRSSCVRLGEHLFSAIFITIARTPSAALARTMATSLRNFFTLPVAICIVLPKLVGKRTAGHFQFIYDRMKRSVQSFAE